MTRESENPCEDVADRVALGEPLGDLAGHAATCGECRSLAAVAQGLATTHRQVDPGLGFSARMTIGARQRLAVRRRRRLAGSLAGVTAASVLGVFVVTRSPKEPQIEAPIGLDEPSKLLVDPAPAPGGDAEMRFLFEVADTRRASRASAPWGRIERPLRPYKHLVRNLREDDVPQGGAPTDSEDQP